MRDEIERAVDELQRIEQWFRAKDDAAWCSRIAWAIRYIKQAEASKPEPAPPDAKPMLEECVAVMDERIAAMNRAGYLHGSDWTLAVSTREAGVTISVPDASLVGEWLISREKAGKGGGE